MNSNSLQVDEVGPGSAVLARAGGGDLMGSGLEDELVDLSPDLL